jgi:hypothetical protein
MKPERCPTLIDHAKIQLTPAGIAENPWLSIPDTRLDPRGHYKVTLFLSTETAQCLIALVEDAMVESLATAKKDNPAKAKTIKPTADTPYTKALDDHGRATDDVACQFDCSRSS